MAAERTRDCWFLVGPTASGKSRWGVELARRLNAEIVSLDSMAIYRRLDIGTAKPSAAERADVPHHLIDIVDPTEDFSLAEYVAQAEQAARAIRARGKEVLFVGGTPLYLKALLRGIFAGPEADWEFRRRIESQAAQHGATWLHEQVRLIDPAIAAKLHPQDQRRLIRAWEVHDKTGVPLSAWQQQFDHARPAAKCKVFVVDWPREELYRRIDTRAAEMFARGLVDEVQTLLAEGVELSRTARQALGYRETLEHLAGVRDLAATIELVQVQTHRFARKQMTWFRGLSECRWLSLGEPGAAEQVIERILATQSE